METKCTCGWWECSFNELRCRAVFALFSDRVLHDGVWELIYNFVFKTKKLYSTFLKCIPSQVPRNSTTCRLSTLKSLSRSKWRFVRCRQRDYLALNWHLQAINWSLITYLPRWFHPNRLITDSAKLFISSILELKWICRICVWPLTPVKSRGVAALVWPRVT